MKTIFTDDITSAVRNLCIQACTVLGNDVIHQLNFALETEESSIGRMVLEKIIQNAEIAAKERIPLCQDTGMRGAKDIHQVIIQDSTGGCLGCVFDGFGLCLLDLFQEIDHCVQVVHQ